MIQRNLLLRILKKLIFGKVPGRIAPLLQMLLYVVRVIVLGFSKVPEYYKLNMNLVLPNC